MTETFCAWMSSRFSTGVAGTAPQVWDWLVYGIAGDCPPVSTPLPFTVPEGVGSPTPKPRERTSIVPSRAVPELLRSVTPDTQYACPAGVWTPGKSIVGL